MFQWEQQWSQHINLYDNCKVLNKISPVHLSSGSASSSQFLPSGADSAPEHQDVISNLKYFLCQSHILPLGQIMVLFSSTFPSWLLFLWQGASFPWLWIKALYASQLAQRWGSFICWLLSAGWVTSGKIAVFVCVSVCVCACVCIVKVRNLGSTLRCLCVSWTPACCLSLFVGQIHSWFLSWHWQHNTWH